MGTRTISVAAVLLGVALMPRLLLGQTQPPWIGTWKLNSAKSTPPREARYKRVVLRIVPLNDGLKVTYDMVGVRGGLSHMEWIGRFDGKDYPVQGLDYVLTNAYSSVDDHTYQIVVRVDGTVAGNTKVAISPDGKTLIAVTTEKGAVGDALTMTTVYEKE